MIIALFPNERKLHSFDLAKGICDYFKARNVTVVADDEYVDKIGAKKLSDIDRTQISFLISMGGDGTILRLSHRFSDIEAPIAGINLGHLGFMADIPIPDIYPSLQDLLDGKFTIEERLILETSSKNKEKFYAVNEVVVHRGGYHSLVEISMQVDGKYLNTFIADGIIIATPNGSTAYSLAAGGPILSPELDAYVITPICAHTISNRPFVLSSNHTLQIQYLSKNPSIEVHCDGVDTFSMETGDSVTVKKSSQKFKLVNLQRHDYYSTLRTKLNWSGKLH
ncbi:MAG: NAD(+)/NADH kinase [Chlamydiota bacterium]|jgi:NAD+ kinase